MRHEKQSVWKITEAKNDQSGKITSAHLREAINYRTLDRNWK
jgi:hypothetical protein